MNPDWTYPAAASKELREFYWDQEIRHLLFDNNKRAPQQPQSSPNKDDLSCSRELIKNIIDTVQKDSTWRDDKLNRQVRIIYLNILFLHAHGNQLLAPPTMLNDPANKYCDRFTLPNWANIVRLVVKAVGPVLSDCMHIYNDLNFLVRHNNVDSYHGTIY